MAGLSVEDGLVMQLHAGSLRNHNQFVFERFGPDRGGDIPVAAEYTRNLRPLLNAFGNDTRFRSCSSRSTSPRTRESWRRSRDTIRRSGSGRRGGFTTASKG